MTSDRIARDYLQRARIRRRALDALMAGGGYPDVVRESQDVVELVLKGALRFAGVEPPKRLEHVLTRLAEHRGPAFYGDEEADIPASVLFGEASAREALAAVDELLAIYTRLLGEKP